MGAGGQGDEDVEMQVAQLARLEPVIGVHRVQDFARLQPIALGGCKDGVVFGESAEELAIRGFRRAPP